MILIKVLPVLAHITLFTTLYFAFWLYFRHCLHPSYRWHQRGNVCYRDARDFACTWAVVVGIVILLVYYGVLKFAWI